MRSLFLVATVASLCVLVAPGCSITATPINGTLCVNNLKSPVMLGDTTVTHSKVGTSEAAAIVGVVMGDCSIKTAMDSAGITKVHHVDSEVFNVLWVYATYKTVVYGE